MDHSLSWEDANNLGVHLLSSGDYSNALGLFRFALSMWKTEAAASSCEQQQQHSTTQESTISTTGKSMLTRSCINKNFVPDHSPNSYLEQVLPTTIHDSLHTRGIQLTIGGDAMVGGSHRRYFFSTDTAQDSNICSAAIVFNLALLFHLRGVQQQQICGGQDHQYKAHLVKALSLYRQSYRLLSQGLGSHFYVRSTGNASLDLLIMALLNNKADLSLSLSDQEESKVMFAQLIRFGISVRDMAFLQYERGAAETGHPHGLHENAHETVNPNITTQFMKRKVESFLLNAALSSMHPEVAAPAA